MTKRIQVIINPAAGQDKPFLNKLNTVFRECDVEWDLSITHQGGDARRFTRQAVADGVDVVAAYGGDGTVAEVASGLVGSSVPLAILPGGTANVMALELGIPNDLLKAARLASGIDSVIERIDVGQIKDHHFLLRVGLGYEAAIVEQADRTLKKRLGIWAYLWSAVHNLRTPKIAHYELTLDGREVECAGFTCAIANSGSLGLPGLKLAQSVTIRDGLLDVIIVEEASWRSLWDALNHVFGAQKPRTARSDAEFQSYSQELQSSIRHWQAKEISLQVYPMQVTQYDGEVLTPVLLPLVCKVLPGMLHVVTPKPTT